MLTQDQGMPAGATVRQQRQPLGTPGWGTGQGKRTRQASLFVVFSCAILVAFCAGQSDVRCERGSWHRPLLPCQVLLQCRPASTPRRASRRGSPPWDHFASAAWVHPTACTARQATQLGAAATTTHPRPNVPAGEGPLSLLGGREQQGAAALAARDGNGARGVGAQATRNVHAGAGLAVAVLGEGREGVQEQGRRVG